MIQLSLWPDNFRKSWTVANESSVCCGENYIIHPFSIFAYPVQGHQVAGAYPSITACNGRIRINHIKVITWGN